MAKFALFDIHFSHYRFQHFESFRFEKGAQKPILLNRA